MVSMVDVNPFDRMHFELLKLADCEILHLDEGPFVREFEYAGPLFDRFIVERIFGIIKHP